MPALVLFGRRWLLSSNDVALPAAACAVFHAVSSLCPASFLCMTTLLCCTTCVRHCPSRSSSLLPLPLSFHRQVWCVLLVIWFASVHGPRECSGAWRYDVAVGGLLGAFALSCGLEVGLVAHGLRGGPFETRRRRLVPRLIYLDFASHLAQVSGGKLGLTLASLSQTGRRLAVLRHAVHSARSCFSLRAL